MRQKTTTKKVKVKGTEEYIRVSTGELVDMNVTSVEERDFNFHKVWMKNFISTLDIIGNKKTKLVYWIIDNLNKENELTYTYSQISKLTTTSLETVRVTVNYLLEVDFLRRKNRGCYMVNPEIIYKGTRNGRMYILNEFSELGKEDETPITDEMKMKNLRAQIELLTKELKKLEGNKTIIDFPAEEVSKDRLSN